jgi:hypothetical protein
VNGPRGNYAGFQGLEAQHEWAPRYSATVPHFARLREETSGCSLTVSRARPIGIGY